MTKFLRFYICTLITITQLFGAEKSITTKPDTGFLSMVAATAAQKAQERLREDSKKPLKGDDGKFNLLGENHFRLLTDKARCSKTLFDQVITQSPYDLKDGDIVVTHEPMPLYPVCNSLYSIFGRNVTIKKDPKNPGYFLCTVSPGFAQISCLSADSYIEYLVLIHETNTNK